MPSRNPSIVKALKDKIITKNQYDKLSEGLLLGIIKKKRAAKTTEVKPSTKKGGTRKTARKAYEPKPKAKAKGKGGVKESRKKEGKEAHKRGRPKGGSQVTVEK